MKVPDKVSRRCVILAAGAATVSSGAASQGLLSPTKVAFAPRRGDGRPSNANLALMVTNTIGPNSPLPDGEGTLPSNNWYAQGRLNPTAPTSFNQLVAWLQAFRAKDAPLDPDVLVCFRNLSGYMLSKSTGLWTRFHFSARPWLGFHYPVGVRGAEYPLTHWSSGSQPFVTQLEPGRFIHLFQPGGFYEVTQSDIAGLIVSFEAWVAPKPGVAIVRPVENTILAGTGLDYYKDGRYQGDAWVGQLVPLTTKPKKIYGTTLTLEQLKANRPPPELAQLRPVVARPVIDDLGDELVLDRFMEDPARWTRSGTGPAAWKIVGGQGVKSGAVGSKGALASGFSPQGDNRKYRFTVGVKALSGGKLDVYAGTTSGLGNARSISGAGPFVMDFIGKTGLNEILYFAGDNVAVKVGYSSVREIRT